MRRLRQKQGWAPKRRFLPPQSSIFELPYMFNTFRRLSAMLMICGVAIDLLENAYPKPRPAALLPTLTKLANPGVTLSSIQDAASTGK